MAIVTMAVDGCEFMVDFDYQPAEAETLEYPGCKEEATINSVSVGGLELLGSLPESTLNKITDAIWDIVQP